LREARGLQEFQERMMKVWSVRAAVSALALMVATAANAAPERSDRILSAQVRLSTSLIERLQTRPGETAIVSPAGVAAAMALLDIGTEDKFRLTAQRVLGFDNKVDAATDFANLRQEMALLNRAGSDGATFTFANAAIFDPNLRLVPDLLGHMRATGAEVSQKALSDPSTVKGINDWVAARTRNRIPSIIDNGSSDANLVILNALYFKSDWATAFDKSQTRPAAFQELDGKLSDVAMMHGKVSMPFRSNQQFAAVDLRYKASRFSLVIATSRNKPASMQDFAGISHWLTGENFTVTEVDLRMPRFTLRRGAELLPALDAAGLKQVRLSPTAFSQLSPDPIAISSVIQKVFLAVNEQGTEAAAATALTTRTATIKVRLNEDRLVVDKPFIFALRDKISGLVLVSGYVGSIPAEATQ
jgi:serine protease inhibitor